MSEAPDEEVISAAIAALKADSDLATLVGGRIFDRVPEKASRAGGIEFPYVSIGPTVSIPQDVDCADAEEITLQFDVWTLGDGDAYTGKQTRCVTRAIRRVLSDAELVLEDNALVALTYELSRVGREADGATMHGVVQFTAIVETPT